MHISHFPGLRELYACKLFVLVGAISRTYYNKIPHFDFCPVKSALCLTTRYVIVECEDQDTQQRDPKTHEMYLNVMRRFSQALLKVQQLYLFLFHKYGCRKQK